MVFLGVFASSAAKKSKISTELSQTLSMPFSCVADINYNGLNVSAKITKNSNENIVMTVISPEELKDFSFVYDQGKITASYMNISLDLTQTNLGALNSYKQIFNVLSTLMYSPELLLEKTADGYTLYYENGQIDFEMNIDSSCRVTSFTIKNDNLSVNIKDFIYA